MSYCAKALAQSLVLSVNGGDGVDGDVDRTEHKTSSVETTVERKRWKFKWVHQPREKHGSDNACV